MKHIPPYGTIGAQYIQRQRWHPTGDDLRVQRALLVRPATPAERMASALRALLFVAAFACAGLLLAWA